MDEAATLDSAWSLDMPTELRRVRTMKGHNQTECAAALTLLGAEPGVQQGDVSNWENGARPASPSRRRAVRDYVSASTAAAATNAPPASETFEDVVREITGERAMTDAQSKVRDDIQHRFREGPSLSSDDGAMFRWLVRFHGLDVTD